MKVIYAQSTMYRKAEYAVLTQFIESEGKRFVLKKAENKKAIPFVNGFVKNYHEMVKQYGEEHVAKGELLSPGLFKMEYVYGETFADRCVKCLQDGDFEGFIHRILYYYQHILCNYEEDNIAIDGFGFTSPDRQYNIDLNLGNIIFISDTDDFKIIDYEWLTPQISKQFAFFRTILSLHVENGEIFEKHNMSLDTLLQGCGMDKNEINMFMKMEKLFYDNVLDWSTKRNEKAMAVVNC